MVNNLVGVASGNQKPEGTIGFPIMHLDNYVDYLRQAEPQTEWMAVRAWLLTGGPGPRKVMVFTWKSANHNNQCSTKMA